MFARSILSSKTLEMKLSYQSLMLITSLTTPERNQDSLKALTLNCFLVANLSAFQMPVFQLTLGYHLDSFSILIF